MGFIKKIWKDRISEFPTRRSLTKTDGTSELVTVARSEGMISEEGDAFSAENMNDFENRVANGFSELNEKTKEVYKSEAPFAVSQTVHMSFIENDSENSVYLISSYRYASAGSMVLTRKDIVEGNWGDGFIIFAKSPESYWVFKLPSNFDLTLVTNHECDFPYISVTRL